MGYSWGMELTQQQHEHLKDLLPRQRGNVKGDNRRVLAAILDVVEQGCKAGPAGAFRQLAYDHTRMNRWAKTGVLDRIFVALQQPQLIRVRVEVVSLDSPVVQVHPDGTGARKKRAASQREVSRRLDDQDSSGCRGCWHGRERFVVAGPSRRCA